MMSTVYRKKSINGTYYFDKFRTRCTYARITMDSIMFKMLAVIYANPCSSRRKIQDIIYHKKHMYSSYSGYLWRNMLADELILKIRNGCDVVYVLGDKGHRVMCDAIKRTYEK